MTASQRFLPAAYCSRAFLVYASEAPACCPEYLKPEDFAALKSGLANRIGPLQAEWQAILERATPDARIILRSAHPDPAWLRDLVLPDHGARLSEHLVFQRELAAQLHRNDRVHTYAGFHIARLAT